MTDPTCGVAHGTEAAEAATDRVLVAVFASPVAECLARYAGDLGFRTVLLEPDSDRATLTWAGSLETAMPFPDAMCREMRHRVLWSR